LGAVDTFFWRYIFVKELDPNILIHELFHAFLLSTDHSDDWIMKAERSPYGIEWYWLTPEQRKVVLRNKWRDFKVMPVTGKDEERRSKESRFYYALGSLFLQRWDLNQATLLLTQSLEIDPTFPPPYNNLAWILATADEVGLRNGKEAVRLALKACELSNWKNPEYLGTLAAAYARVGDFDKAIQWQEKALEGMKSLENRQEGALEPLKPYENDKTVELRRRLNLYRTHKPWPPN
jgi:tetratricopeptide (TPR) repeat protein